jgi:uncharacterized protein YybS (DUF2232 family)
VKWLYCPLLIDRKSKGAAKIYRREEKRCQSVVVPEDAAKSQMFADVGKFTALTILFCLSVAILPAFSFLTLPLCSLPVLTIAVRHGVKAGLTAAFVSGAILIPLIGVIAAVPLWLVFTFLGLGYFFAVEKKISFAKVIAAGTAVVIIALLLMALLTFLIVKVNIVTQQVTMLERFLLAQQKEYVKQGISEKQVEEQFKTIKESLKIFPTIIPAATIIFSIWISFLNFILSGLVLKKLKKTGLSLPAFKDWQFPWYFAWGYIIGLSGTFFSGYFGSLHEIGRNMGINFLLVFNSLFMVQGFSIIYFYMEQFKIRSLLRALGIGLLIVIPLATQMVAWFGLLDVWLNFRKIPTEA